jgi:hypothetical protein
MISFIYAADTGANNAVGRTFSDTVYNMVLVANTENHITIPTAANKVVINSTVDVYFQIGNSTVSASVPSSNVTNGLGSDLNPSVYYFKPTDTTISAISTIAGIVSLNFYA